MLITAVIDHNLCFLHEIFGIPWQSSDNFIAFSFDNCSYNSDSNEINDPYDSNVRNTFFFTKAVLFKIEIFKC